MTSKSSFFNQTAAAGRFGFYFEDLRRRLWSIALVILVFFFALPVASAVQISNLKRELLVQDPAVSYEILLLYVKKQVFYQFSRYAGPGNVFGIIMAILALVVAMSGFSYLFSGRQTDFYHSLPLRRERLFCTVTVNSILITAVPYALMSFVSAVIVAAYSGRKAAFGIALTGFLYHMAIFLLCYAFVTLSVMLTGTLVVCALGAVVFYFIGPFLVHTISTLFACYFRTFYNDRTLEIPWLQHSSPVFWSFDLAGDAGMSASGASVFVAKALWALLWFAALTALNVFLYQKRPSEAAGHAISFEWAKAPIKLILSSAVGLAAGAFVQSLLDLEGDGWVSFAAVCGVVLTACLLEIIFHADFKRLFAHWPQILVSTCAVFLVLAIFRFDLTGYDVYVPARENVESVGIYADELEPNVWMYQQTIQLEQDQRSGRYYANVDYSTNVSRSIADNMSHDPDVAYRIVRQGILDLESQRESGQYEIDYENVRNQYLYDTLEENTSPSYADFHEPCYDSLLVSWHLKNGRIVYRRYFMDLTRIRAELDEVHDSDAFKSVSYPVLSMDPETLCGINYSTGFGHYHVPQQDKALEQEVLRAYQEEFAALTAQDRRLESPIACLQFKDYDFQNMVDTIRNQNDGYIGMFNDYGYYPVYPSFTRTIALLKKCDVDLMKAFLEDHVTSIRLVDNRGVFGGEYDYSGAQNHEIAEVEDPEKIREIIGHSYPMDMSYYNTLRDMYNGIDVYVSYDSAVRWGDNPLSVSGAEVLPAGNLPSKLHSGESANEYYFRLYSADIPSFIREEYGLSDLDIYLESSHSY